MKLTPSREDIVIGKGRIVSVSCSSWSRPVWALPGRVTTYDRDRAERNARNIDTITTLQTPGAAEKLIDILRGITQ